MSNTDEVRKHVSAAICALLFSSICLLSAVGPVRAAEAGPHSAASSEMHRSAAVVPLA